MARLGHWGAESGHQHAENLTLTGTTLTFDTGTKRTGTRSFKFDSSAATYLEWAFTGATNRTYYFCAYFLFPSATGMPTTATTELIFWRAGAGQLAATRITSAGKLQLWDSNAGAQVGSDSSATLTTDTWYRIEMVVNINSGAGADDTIELYLDGVQVAASSTRTLSANAPSAVRFGWVGDPGTSEVVFVDDVAVNDSTGSINNGLVGEHAVACLLPTADSADGNWTDGAGGTASIFEAVNNTPPTGVATASSGAANQAENASNSVPSNLDQTMTTYTAAGVGSDQTVKALYTVIEAGSSSTTGSDTITHELVSNPAVAANGTNSVDIVAGTYPASWNRGQGTITEDPTITKGTAPVMRVTKTGAVTRIHTVCFMGIMVGYSPTPAGRRNLSPIMVN
jgi:hypothetical protein